MTVDGEGLMGGEAEEGEPVPEGAHQAVEVDPTGRFSRFDVVLGKGASKIVYKGFDRVQGIEVAWNQVKLPESVRDLTLTRLFSEISVLRKLKHRNIMKFYTSWVDNKQRTVNFITEYFHSGTLRRHRMTHKCVTLQVLKRWAWQILQGLVYLHGHHPPIIHRDLKCDNIFIHGVTGEVKIGDLGMAKLLTAGLSKAQSVLGTPEYMAPELYDERYNEKIDIYAYGMCLMELVTMEFPYMECDNRCQIFRKVTLGVYPAALARIEETEVRDFIELCISHDHIQRPSARELLKNPFFDSLRAQGMGALGHNFSEASMACPAVISLPGAKTFSLRLTEVQGRMLKFKLGIKASEGAAQCFAFPFDALLDTVEAVAEEMETDFELTPAEAEVFKLVLEAEVAKARPLVDLETNTSGPLSPVPAGGSSSERTASCDGTLSDLASLAASASEPCLTGKAASRLFAQGGSGDKLARKTVRPLVGNGTKGHSGKLPIRCRSDGEVRLSPWVLEDMLAGVAGLIHGDSGSRGVQVRSLMRKRCKSEPALVLEKLPECEDSSAAMGPRQHSTCSRTCVSSKALAAVGNSSDMPMVDDQNGGNGGPEAHPVWRSGSLLKSDRAAEVLWGSICMPEEGATSAGHAEASSSCVPRMPSLLTGPKIASGALPVKGGMCPHPVAAQVPGAVAHDREREGQGQAGSAQDFVGMIGGLSRRRSWSSSLTSQLTSQGEETAEGACQWSQQEIKPRDILASGDSGGSGGFAAARRGSMDNIHRNGHGHSRRRSAERFRGHGGMDGLSSGRLPSHARRQSAREIRWQGSTLSPVDMAGLDSVDRMGRSASVPIKPPVSGSATLPPLTSRYSSPCGSMARDRGLWRTLTSKVMRRRRADQQMDSTESPNFDSLGSFRRSLGSCVPVQRPSDSPLILSHLEAM
ncbi:unnamed protein product [Ostreobium quekettii]|uniref:non-specific serine/threonine protein kinase n=1 Tax=Ostreobium quekettii TaxID=121088 RepID=A0A8S1J1N1_9CHLO|nr:unnamed protein product [Ostreobium quekettii]|eukprot:evm.model.scf_580EXC.7 EVM.evm.TU.scf_580EXC.7   scf_580EXC:57329-64280(+)